MTRKVVIGGGITVLVLVIAVVAFLFLSLDRIIKTAVESLGPEMTKSDVKLAEVSLSATSGMGTLKGLSIGNPEGFKTERAFYLGEVSVEVDTASITTDTIIINKVLIDSPQITYELSGGGSNLDRIQKNVEEYTGAGSQSSAPAEQEEGGKKLIIKELVISGGQIGVSAAFLGGKQLDAPLPTIRLTDIGKEEEGASAGEVVEEVMASITKAAGSAVGSLNLDDLSKKATEGMKSAGDAAKGAADKAGDMLRNLNPFGNSDSK